MDTNLSNANTSSVDGTRPPDLIAKKYRVMKTLGQGAMGEVYLVLPPHGDPVALKLLRTLEEKAGRNAIEQFENEFRVLKRLSHPNIGRIFDYGYDPNLQKVFFTMPCLKGSDIFKSTENLPFEQCEELFVQTLRALNYLHQKNLIHCDLKPGNIYVEESKALLIDFGLAGYFGDFIVGTPTYLAPEIYQGAHHNALSDLYAMGVIFYNCLTRSQPFSGKTLQEVYDRHRALTPPPIHEVNKKVPKYFSDIVATLLNKKPEERFPNAAAVIDEIAAFSKKKYSIETEETLLSYLPTQSELIGRKDALLDIQTAFNAFLSQNIKADYHLVLVHGRKNVGKSKVVNKMINDLQLAKVQVEKVPLPLQDSDRDILFAARALVLENIGSYAKSPDETKHLEDFVTLLERKIMAPGENRFLCIFTAEREADFAAVRRLFPAETTETTVIELLPYTKDETEEFLVSVIGQKEIPRTFLDQFFRNTEGLPDIATELIQSMIEKGLLFDKSGRWNEDLLAELDKAFDKLEISESLEQEFERIYAGLSSEEEGVVAWLSLCPHGLTLAQLNAAAAVEFPQTVLAGLVEKRILRHESGLYALSRKIFENFVRQNLPDKEVRKRHTRLAAKAGLDKKWAAYHLSLGDNPALAIKAGELLATLQEKDGEREQAVATYQRLLSEHPAEPVSTRLEWVIHATTLLIWLDRFDEAVAMSDTMEKELQQTKANVEFARFLTLIEKKGLALMHRHDFELAEKYFKGGLKSAQKDPAHLVHALRFENDLAVMEFVLDHNEKAVEIFKATREKAKALPPPQLSELTNNDLGHVYLQCKEYPKSLAVLVEDMRWLAKLPNQEPYARALYSFSRVMKELNDIPKAIRAFEECIRICKKGHFLPLLLRTYNGLGTLYYGIGKYEECLTNYQKALDLAVRMQDTTSKSALLFNLGWIYKNQKNFALAARRFLLVIQLLDAKEKKLPTDHTRVSDSYNALAVMADEENNTLKALSYTLERENHAEHAQFNEEERFRLDRDIAEMYLKNRLAEPFLKAIEKLKPQAQTPERLGQVQALETEWRSIQSNTAQDSTGRISISPQPFS